MQVTSVAIRVDVSRRIGTGHFLRCLTLANVLSLGGVVVRFVTRGLPPIFQDTLSAKGHEYVLLDERPASPALAGGSFRPLLAHSEWLPVSQQQDAADTIAALEDRLWDWLIVDHYALDWRWEQALRKSCHHLMVIDDLADRRHECDLLLDQNLGRRTADYDDLVAAGCLTLIGPHYALLRPEFAQRRYKSLLRRTAPALERLLISLGGVDPDNATGRILSALKGCNLPDHCRISVVLGATAPWIEKVRQGAGELPWPVEVLVNVEDMASLIADSDVAIGAAGGSAWERCALGLPTILLILAENQRCAAAALADSGGVVLVGDVDTVCNQLASAIQHVLLDGALTRMSQAAAKIADGGGAERIARIMFAMDGRPLHAREATANDESLLLVWANDSLTRKNSLNPDPICPETHHVWFTKRLDATDTCRIYIVEQTAGLEVGQVRFERVPGGDWEIHYGLAVDFRGQGLGVPLLEAALRAFQNACLGETVIGRVRVENRPSCRVFERLGFDVRIDESRGLRLYRKCLNPNLVRLSAK